MTTPTLYKVLTKDGKNCHGGTILAWPLPTGDEPGAWLEIPAEEPLVWCEHGFHVTSDPRRWWHAGHRVFLAEVEGDVITYANDDKVCVRKVRLVREVRGEALQMLIGKKLPGPLAERARELRKPVIAKIDRHSPALLLVMHVYHNVLRKDFPSRVKPMTEAVTLAIRTRLRFARGDIKTIREFYNIDRLTDLEELYREAIKAGNDSACASFEAYFERPAFVWDGKRLAIGDTFRWPGVGSLRVEDLAKKGTNVRNDWRRKTPLTFEGSAHVAPRLYAVREKYVVLKDKKTWRTKVDKRVTLTAEELRAAEKARLNERRAKRA